MPEINTDLIKKHALSLEFDKVLEILSNFAISDIGKQKCLCAPIYSQKAQIEYRLELTTEAKKFWTMPEIFLTLHLIFSATG